ncbi:3-hydroxy-3-methylglutaryl-ACP synthase [Massilia sp. CCM 8695]|uniref:3-hydroxy-3-methylglutaryl-ACP synthase n=1 Tax=Massilia frigida TaxID=2609281 RepID=A0ABX0N7Q1_9BURK|nr:hydroxymethylglutaryl-CoA synthase family protein [Massilia frigida]NHZ81422.1 3-hydroxy-3-methylglutaryl-ACP synthase [Massilia frigida]
MRAGIEDMGVYVGRAALDVNVLAAARGLDVQRMHNLLMREKTVALPFEDAVTFAVNAAKPVIDRLGPQQRERIEQLIVASESGVDFGKPLSTYVHQALGLSRNCRTFEVKHACYGGTAALQSALAHAHAGLSPGAKSLVITTDMARPIPHTYAEPSQGAAGVAMLIGDQPLLVEIEKGLSGCYGFEVMDSCRPTPDIETGDADLSLLTYLECMENSFLAYQRKAPGTSFGSFDYLAVHTPFGGMAKGAHRTMMRKFERVAPALVEQDFLRRLEPSLRFCARVGNIYSGTVFLALAGILALGRFDDAPKRVGLFSYGSGCCSEFYSAVATAASQRAIARLDIGAHLDARHALSMAEYERLLETQQRLRFGVRDAEPESLDWERLMRGRGLLVLDRIKDYHREYRWA